MTPGINPDTERRLIAACMIGGAEAFAFAAGEGVVPESFADAFSRACWRAASVCIAQGATPDCVGLYRALAGMDGEAKPSVVEIAALGDMEPTAMRLRGLTCDVIDLARRRRLISAVKLAVAAAEDSSLREWSAVWDAVEPHIRASQETTTAAKARPLAEVAKEAKRMLLEPDDRDTVPSIMPTWDEAATPCRGGQLIVIAGRPGAGKSAFAGQVAHNIAKSGKLVAFFSLEMSAEEVLTRIAKLRTNPSPQFPENIAKELDALAKWSTLRIYEVENARTVAQIEAICRLLASSPKGLGAVVIDYLQLVAPPAGAAKENREQQVAAMSRAFKLLARTLRVPVFLLAQLNREVEKDKNRAPRLSDLRESGAIEQDADRVWFVYPANSDETASSAGRAIDVKVMQAKCRSGPGGIVGAMRFDRVGMLFARGTNDYQP